MREAARFALIPIIGRTVKVGEAKTHLSDPLAKVEAGEEVIIARGNEAIAKLDELCRPRLDFGCLDIVGRAERSRGAVMCRMIGAMANAPSPPLARNVFFGFGTKRAAFFSQWSVVVVSRPK